jgi:imidazole glycerol-phosphate synthase subunit HisH
MIVIIDTGVANIASVFYALKRIGKEGIISREAAQITQATHVILPGVGSAGRAMHTLKTLALDDVIKMLKQPVLGICLGMQLMYEHSEEDDVPCLGIIPGRVQRLKYKPHFAIPHMGWNQCYTMQDSPLLKDIPNESFAYFVHSYAVPLNTASCAYTQYSEQFTAIAQWNNFFATQFHPERSAQVGQQILKNFVRM